MKRFLRPPGAGGERDFLARCIRCGKCAHACPYRVIKLATWLDGLAVAGTPYLDARTGPCQLCMKCPPVCPSGALDSKLRDKREVRMGTGAIDKETCLAWRESLCRSCYQSCPIFDEAITMDDALRPVVDRKKCVGCGICENVCPVESAAIVVEPRGDRESQ